MGGQVASEPIRTAVIGCGFQGTYHAKAIVSSPQTTLITCCDEVPERASSLSAATGVSSWSDDWESVLDRSDIDAVVIATTTHNHAQLAVAAARTGKHILLEKPMATSVDDCLKIERAVAEAGVTLMIGFKFRYAPAVIAAKKAVPKPIVLTAHTLYDAEQTTAGWLNNRSISGGRLMSSLVHAIDLLRFLSGSEPVRIAAEGGTLAIEGLTEPDNAVATVLFENGSIASLVHGTAGKSALLSTWAFQSAGHGINATIFDHGRRMRLHKIGTEDSPEVIDPVDDPFAAGMQPLVDAFADTILKKIPPNPGPRDGTVSVLLSRLVERAITTGQTQAVDLPPIA